MNRTRIHNVTHTNMNDWEFKAAYMKSLYYGVPQVKISKYMDFCPICLSESLLYEFLIFLLVTEAPVFISLPLRLDRCKWTEVQWKLHFARKSLGRKSSTKCGKWTKPYDRHASLKCKSRLAVAQPQKIASCWQTLSLHSETQTHRHENNHFIIPFYLYFFM